MKKLILMAALMVAGIVAFTSCGNRQKTETENIEKTDAADVAESTVAIGVTDVVDNKIDTPAGKPYIIDFGATWCGPCQQFHPVFEQAAKDYAGKLAFFYVDVDENSDLASMYAVEVVPTVVGVNAQGVVTIYNGFMNDSQLASFIDSLL